MERIKTVKSARNSVFKSKMHRREVVAAVLAGEAVAVEEAGEAVAVEEVVAEGATPLLADRRAPLLADRRAPLLADRRAPLLAGDPLALRPAAAN